MGSIPYHAGKVRLFFYKDQPPSFPLGSLYLDDKRFLTRLFAQDI
jgi:TorA maturation chaperone TorD